MPKTHHRASTKLVKKGDPIFVCYCGSANFHRFKLGFDRIFWVEEIRDKIEVALQKNTSNKYFFGKDFNISKSTLRPRGLRVIFSFSLVFIYDIQSLITIHNYMFIIY